MTAPFAHFPEQCISNFEGTQRTKGKMFDRSIGKPLLSIYYIVSLYIYKSIAYSGDIITVTFRYIIHLLRKDVLVKIILVIRIYICIIPAGVSRPVTAHVRPIS